MLCLFQPKQQRREKRRFFPNEVIMKGKITAAILSAAFFISALAGFAMPAHASGSVSASLKGSSQIKTGDTYTVSLDLTDISAVSGGGIYGAQLSVSYDSSAFAYEDTELSSQVGWELTANASGGKVRIECSDHSAARDQPVIATGTFLTLKFRARDDAAAGSYRFSLTSGSVTTNLEEPVSSAASAESTASGASSSASEKSAASTVTKTETMYISCKSASVSISEANSALLRSLYVSGHRLSPSFSPYKTSYTVSVSNTVSSIRVHATAQDGNAQVVVSGPTDNLSIGYNTVAIKVTATNGSIKTYYITVVRLEKDESGINSAALAAYLAQHGQYDGSSSGLSSAAAKQSGSSSSGKNAVPLGQTLLCVGIAVCVVGIVISLTILRVRGRRRPRQVSRA